MKQTSAAKNVNLLPGTLVKFEKYGAIHRQLGGDDSLEDLSTGKEELCLILSGRKKWITSSDVPMYILVLTSGGVIGWVHLDWVVAL